MSTITLTIPGCQPPSLNTWLSKHWRKRWEDKQAIEWMVKQTAMLAELPPVQGRVDVWVTVYNASKATDADNVPIKGFIDGLRYAGVLREDDPQHVRWAGSRCAGDDGEARVVIEISEVME